MTFARSLGFLILVSFVFVGCADAPVGSKRRPFAMYFIPSVDSQKLAASAQEASKFVSKYVSQKLYQKDDGFYVEASVPTSYIAVIEAFGTKKADLAAMTTYSYILGRDIKKYPIEAALTVLRDHGEKTYKGQIVAHVDSGIKTIKDFKGKRFAYTDPASTSGFVLPAKVFKDNGVELGETVFGQKHDNVITMVYQKQVDGGATYYSPPLETEENGKKSSVIRDARSRVITQFPDVEKKVKIISFTDAIPNEPWVIRSNLFADAAQNEKIKNLVVEALVEFGKTPEGKKMLDDVATAQEFVTTSDREYDVIRQTVLSSQMDLEKILLNKKN